MSDVPHSPGWWQAGDGRWYPSPPGLTDETPSRPPTPAPDHPPYPFDPSAQSLSGPLAPIPRPSRSRRRPLIISGLALLVVGALLVVIGIAISSDKSTTANSNDPKYQMAVEDLLNSELTNLVFIETFWDSYSHYRDAWTAATDEERKALTDQWLSDIDTEVAQFQHDLQQIEDDYAARTYADGSIPDSVRDLAMNHYKAWQRWAAAIVPIANDWLQDRTSALSLYGYVTEVRPELDTSIETTFKALCGTLKETQPTDGSYMLTIDDVCANS
jgi:hypothetical protein